jgi:hypothetical protein
VVGYNAYRVRTQARLHKRYHMATHERRQAIGMAFLVILRDLSHDLSSVVLRGDNPVALPLILALEKKGFIIIASVATPEAVDELERGGKGYVKALVLDPFEVRLCFPGNSHSTHTTTARYNPDLPSLLGLHFIP